MGWVIGLAIALIGGALYFGIQSDHQFENHCHEMGGTVKNHGQWSYGGKTPTYSETSYCLSPDGRILDIQ